MKTKIYLLLILLTFFAIAGCKKSDPVTNTETPVTPTTPTIPTTPTTPTTPTVPSGLYAVGITNVQDYFAQAAIWKNGVKTILSTNYSYAMALAVSGSDIYTVGSLMPNSNNTSLAQPCYWKNDTMVKLFTDDSQTGQAKAILVQGTDVYIAGEFRENQLSGKKGVYWKNGVRTALTPPTNSRGEVTVTGIAMSGTDIYISGYYNEPLDNLYPVACYWKNEAFVSLDNISHGTGGASSSTTSGIMMLGGDIYICGKIETNHEQQSTAVYWKNGILNKLASSDVVSDAESISTNGTDIYITGRTGNTLITAASVYWKNGSPNIISGFGWVWACAAQGNDLYLGGISSIPSGYGLITKNGTSITLENTRSNIYGITVVP